MIFLTHIVLQQDKHAALSQLLRRDELVPGLLHLLRWYLPAAPPLVVQVQPTAIHLLQLILEKDHVVVSRSGHTG